MRRAAFLEALIAALALTVAASAALAKQEPYAPVIDPADFVRVVNNPYFPLTPGMTMIYEGVTKDGFEHVEDFVTHRTKRIRGVRCTEVQDRVWLDGELIEETFDWYAQDVYGNVWYFGEFSTEFEGGIPVSHEGSWEAGVDGAFPGIIMLAYPEVGDTYRQEFYEGVAEDMARVHSLDESVCVAYGCFDNVLVTKEWTPLEPGFTEYKYYAPGVGLILEVGLHGGQGSVGLVDIVTE